ncbi:MAG: glutamate--cysteine ligase [Thermostichales cyanobacterium SZTDM-1c_bins_54]
MQLLKGFEVEMYTGRPDGEVVGLADRITRDLPGFVREPDRRNVEYVTPPLASYSALVCELLRPRQILRRYLAGLGDLTLLPGSTLALGGSDHFERSDPSNPYHSFIERTYGTRVVTTSIHINVGLPLELLFPALRLVRAEASLYLALSASSPFLDGRLTGSHSHRWQVFPETPDPVPIFRDHAHYCTWVEAQLRSGQMQNERHLWTSVRPNGPRRPYDLNRLELRISDLVANPLVTLAMTALLETRLHSLADDPTAWDPLAVWSGEELLVLCRENERRVARDSLAARVIHWQTGAEIAVSEWLEQQVATAWRIAQPLGWSSFLAPLQQVLQEGNEAMRWLRQVQSGQSIAEVYAQAIQEMALQELELCRCLCRDRDLQLL